MSGHLNGVAARIEKEVPSAIFVHCFAHCTNLCLQSVGWQCGPIRDALDLVMEMSQLILKSPKRTTLFLALQAQLSPGSNSLRPLFPTRWTVRTGAVSAVITNYAVLCTSLEEINATTHDDYGHKAGGMLALIDKLSTFWAKALPSIFFPKQNSYH